MITSELAKVKGKIRSMRSWRVTEDGELMSIFANDKWPRGVMRASCRLLMIAQAAIDISEIIELSHPVPNTSCYCGIYGYKFLRDESLDIIDVAYMYINEMPRHVISKRNLRIYCKNTAWGVIEQWGRVIEHQTGYRSQYAMPVHIYLFPLGGVDKKAKAIREKYDVEVTIFDRPLLLKALDYANNYIERLMEGKK